jgi:phosphatidylglycerophosphate synthase
MGAEKLMLDEKLRKLKDRWLRPLVGVAGRLSPNAITLLALAVGLAAAGAAAQQLYGLGLALWAINRILDGLDGAVARGTGRQTDFGGYLDIVADFVVYAAVPIGLFLGLATVELGASLALLLASFYVNGASWMYLAAILEKRSAGAGARGDLTTVAMPAGLIGGTETVLFYTAFFLWPSAARWLFLLMAALVLVGVVQRLAWARRHLAELPAQQSALGVAASEES